MACNQCNTLMARFAEQGRLRKAHELETPTVHALKKCQGADCDFYATGIAKGRLLCTECGQSSLDFEPFSTDELVGLDGSYGPAFERKARVDDSPFVDDYDRIGNMRKVTAQDDEPL